MHARINKRNKKHLCSENGERGVESRYGDVDMKHGECRAEGA